MAKDAFITVEGEVTEVTDFGAFVRLSDKLDGLIHSSEIDWKFIEDPREILKSGEKIKAKIINLDGGRVSLSLKALKEDPWLKIEDKYKVGEKIKAKIIKVKNTGAFVELPSPIAGSQDSIIGLIPSTEFSEQNPIESIEVGKEYDLAIVNIDAKEHKLALTFDKKAE